MPLVMSHPKCYRVPGTLLDSTSEMWWLTGVVDACFLHHVISCENMQRQQKCPSSYSRRKRIRRSAAHHRQGCWCGRKSSHVHLWLPRSIVATSPTTLMNLHPFPTLSTTISSNQHDVETTKERLNCYHSSSAGIAAILVSSPAQTTASQNGP